MIKKLIWTAIFLAMGLLGSLAAFNIADVWTSLQSYWNESFWPLVEGFKNGDLDIAVMFSFIGGTIFIAIVAGPIWYLWKGTGIIKFGIVGFVLRIVFMIILFLVPSILGIINQYKESWLSDASLNNANMVFTWIIIAIALFGLWVRS